MNSSDNSTPVKAGYDLWSSFYDTYSNSTVAKDDGSFPSLWRDVHDSRVLEIGCGTGRHTRRLLAQGNRVIGMDVSPGMLAVAREKLSAWRELQLVEADFVQCDVEALGSFDVVLAALVLEHIQDLGSFFENAAAVLVPGGSLYISEIHPIRAAGGTLANFVTGEGEVHRLHSFAHSVLAIENAAAQAGLVRVSTHDVFGDEELARINPDWRRHLNKPLIKLWHWQKPS